MKIQNIKLKITAQIIFVIIFFSTSPVKSLDKFNKAERVSDYFSGILLLNDNKYNDSLNYFKKLNGLETSHINYSVKYLYSLVNSGNLREAFKYSKKLEKQKLDSFESHLISGIYYLKNSKKDLAQKYFLKAKERSSGFILNDYVSNSLFNWSNLSDLSQSLIELKKLGQRFENLKKIQKAFLHCYFDSSSTEKLYTEILSNQETDFSRYNYFFASYFVSTGRINKAKEVVTNALELYPRNLLLNQYKIDLNAKNNILKFDCKKEQHVVAEILYITANALSSQSIFPLSNFYLKIGRAHV